MKRVLVFTGHFFPHVGGVERFSRELWQRFPAKGWEVRLVTSNTNGAPDRERIDGIEVFRLPVVKVLQGRLPLPLPTPKFFRTLAQALDPLPDVIVTNTRFFFTSVLGVRIGKRHRIPVLHIDHGSAFIGLGNPIVTFCGTLFDRAVGGYVLRRASSVKGVSGAVNRFIETLGGKPDGVIYNGVDAASYRGIDPALRGELGLSSGDQLIVFVGRLLEDKGIFVLLDAFEQLRRERPTESNALHLAILGDGPVAGAVKERIKGDSRIHFLGFRPPEKVREALASADIFVHPSYYPEGLPTSVLEAAAAGCAIIATPAGGTGEIIDSTDRGILVPERDAQSLARALGELAADPERRQRLGHAVSERASQIFDWDRIAEGVHGHLSNLAPYPKERE